MFCTNCGKQIPDGSVFCPECGATLDTAPAAPAKKGLNLSKNAIIGIAVAAVAVIVAVILIIVLGGGVKNKLKGTWKMEMYGMKMEMTFKAGGKGQIKMSGYGQSETSDFKWSVGSNNKLVITDEDGDKTTMKWSKDAKDGKSDCWYIDGKTLYVEGMELKK